MLLVHGPCQQTFCKDLVQTFCIEKLCSGKSFPTKGLNGDLI